MFDYEDLVDLTDRELGILGSLIDASDKAIAQGSDGFLRCDTPSAEIEKTLQKLLDHELVEDKVFLMQIHKQKQPKATQKYYKPTAKGRYQFENEGDELDVASEMNETKEQDDEPAF